jgi:hypothetical protein
MRAPCGRGIRVALCLAEPPNCAVAINRVRAL